MNDSPDDRVDIDALLAVPPAAGFAACFREGLSAPWWGFKYLNRRRRLWAYAIWPVLINLAITVIVLAAVSAAVAWTVILFHGYVTAAQTGWLYWLLVVVEIVLALLVLLILPTGLGSGVAWLAQGAGDKLAVLAGAAVAALVLVGESWLMSLWFGSVFMRTDLASAGVSVD